MTFADMYGDALDTELGSEDRATLFTTVRRKAAINAGVQEFARLTECFRREASIALLDDTREYDVEATATDFVNLAAQGLEVALTLSGVSTYLAGDDLPRRDVPWLDRYQAGWRTTSAGTPGSYYVRQADGAYWIGLVPAPDLTSYYTSGTLRVPYIAQPPLMAGDSDVPYSISSNPVLRLAQWHHAAVHFAASRLEALRKNVDAINLQRQAFAGYVQDYLGRQIRRNGSHVVFARDYRADARRGGSGVSIQGDPLV